MPPGMGDRELSKSLQAAQVIADLQPSSATQHSYSQQSAASDPGASSSGRISSEDLKVMREKFPQLNDFSEQFLQSRILEELLRIESTSLRIRDSEKARETEERLAQNKYNLASKFYDVPVGKDNRWSELHPARLSRAWPARPRSNSRGPGRSSASPALQLWRATT